MLTAAALKAVAPPVVEEPSQVAPEYVSLASLVELLIGSWLWSGLYANRARWLALGLFALFIGFNWSEGMYGTASCACFGPLHIGPLGSLGVDVVGLVALCYWRPRLDVPPLVPLPLLSVAGAGLALMAFPNFMHSQIRAGTVLSTIPPEVRLGAVARGGKARGTFILRNAGHTPIALTAIRTSCRCVRVTVPDPVVQPGQDTYGEIRTDLQEAARFTGKLELEITGFDNTGKRAFALAVLVEVK